MNSMTRRLAAACRMELRLLTRHWTYLLLHVAWVGLLWFMFRNIDLGTAHFALEQDLRSMPFALLSLLSLFVAAAVGTRSERVRFLAVESTLPTGPEIVIGRWLAVVIALLCFLSEPLVIALWQGPASSFLAGFPVYLLEGFILIGFSVGAGWWLTERLGGRRWVYPLLLGGWILMLLSLNLLSEARMQCHSLTAACRSGIWAAATLLHFMQPETGIYEELWGRLTQGTLPVWFDLFYVGLVILLVAMLVRNWERRQLRRMRPGSAVASLLALLLAGVSAGGYVRELNQRADRFNADMDYYQRIAADAQIPGQTAEVVDAYELKADMSNPADPVFDARLTLRNAGKAQLTAFGLTLNRHLMITEAGLPIDRDGDFITVRLVRPLEPGQTIELPIKYHGPLEIGFRYIYDMVLPGYFTTRDGVRLSTGAAWYPLPGKVWYASLVEFSPELGHAVGTYDPRQMLPSPAAVHLKVVGPKTMVFASNLPSVADGEFAARSASWVSLFGAANLRVQRVGNVTVVAPRDDMATIAAYAPQYDKVRQVINAFFPDVKTDGMQLAAIDGLQGVPNGTPPVGQRVDIYGDRRMITGVGRYFFADLSAMVGPVAQDIWTLGGGEPGPVYEGVARFMYVRYKGGLDRVGELLKDPENNPESLLAIALEERFQQEGEPGVIPLLRRVRERSGAAYPASGQEREWVRQVLAP